MEELETSLHLYQPPLYSGQDGNWYSSFEKAASTCSALTVDSAAVLSILNFGWVCGDLTLFHEVRRRPWLSRVGEDHRPILRIVPKHGWKFDSASNIASDLLKLLEREAQRVCEKADQVCVLLSGGLDSRIVAGVLSRLYRAGDLKCKPFALTWGFSQSRDAYYAHNVAKTLGFDWENVEFGPDTVMENIDVAAKELGCLHSPEMLHYMTWFKNMPEKTIVLAGSYGDSIGRAEFAGKHLLELSPFRAKNPFQLFKINSHPSAIARIRDEFSSLDDRIPGSPVYAQCEAAMQGHRMRGGLSHALSIINKYCKVYQMFTDPAVYSYMWSIHPSYRNDEIYLETLRKLDGRLANMPWARTNRAIKGKTVGAKSGLKEQYHDYTKWSQGPLYMPLNNIIDPEWFAHTGLFVPENIAKLSRSVKQAKVRVGRLNDIWLWLAAFRRFIEFMESSGLKIDFSPQEEQHPELFSEFVSDKPVQLMYLLQYLPSRFEQINRMLKSIRGNARNAKRAYLRKKAINKYPPS
ncbi:asparagine synthase [delta proteobacterium NaphS2]|nr:asparagine synthase [delta proteobacterium NaphS2]